MRGLEHFIITRIYLPAVERLLDDGAAHLPRCRHLSASASGITCPICLSDLGIVCAACFGPHPSSHGAGCDYCGSVPAKDDHLFDALPVPLGVIATSAGRERELDPTLAGVLLAGVSLCRRCGSTFGVAALH